MRIVPAVLPVPLVLPARPVIGRTGGMAGGIGVLERISVYIGVPVERLG